MATPKSIAIIIGSTRAVRIGDKVAAWVKEHVERNFLPSSSEVVFPLVDVAAFRLPVFDEAIVPANIPERGQFAHAHSKAWTAEIARHDGYVLVSPEYNGGVPGGVKNAIDYLRNEWRGRPIAIITYGILGGNQSSDQLAQVLTRLKLRVAPTRPKMQFAGGYGPDASAAAEEGVIGEETRKLWDSKFVDQVLQAAQEVKDLLGAPESAAAAV